MASVESAFTRLNWKDWIGDHKLTINGIYFTLQTTCMAALHFYVRPVKQHLEVIHVSKQQSGFNTS